MTPVQQRLFALQDPDYRAFHCTLIPNVPVDKIIGIRTPALRSLARELSGTHEAELFLDALPHEYYEENNLHSFLLCRIRNDPERHQCASEFFSAGNDELHVHSSVINIGVETSDFS